MTKPFTLVIFGVTGDLSTRMLLPALYDLAAQKLLPQSYRIIGVSRRETSAETLFDRVRGNMEAGNTPYNNDIFRQLGKNLEFLPMDASESAGYIKLRDRLSAIEHETGVCMNRLFYMATPAGAFKTVAKQLGANNLNKSCPHGTGHARLLIEKPFGSDLASAKTLTEQIRQHFEEEQIYRIDHFLAKETAQNVLAFRFQNALFRAVWNRTCISHILVSATETIDIKDRGNFYEETGALRDMIQSHVLQMLALATMDIPETSQASDLHRQRLALLRSIKPVAPEHAVRGQYTGYRNETNNPNSVTETYATLRLTIDNDRWRGVPVLVRSGKALDGERTEITVIFTDRDPRTMDNSLTIRLGRAEGISLGLRAKKPGFNSVIQDVIMDFQYEDSFPGERHPAAYERVLMDAFRDNNTLFATSEETIESWRILEPVIRSWRNKDNGLESYAKGSTGPAGADRLAQQAGISWLTTQK